MDPPPVDYGYHQQALAALARPPIPIGARRMLVPRNPGGAIRPIRLALRTRRRYDRKPNE